MPSSIKTKLQFVKEFAEFYYWETQKIPLFFYQERYCIVPINNSRYLFLGISYNHELKLSKLNT